MDITHLFRTYERPSLRACPEPTYERPSLERERAKNMDYTQAPPIQLLRPGEEQAERPQHWRW